MTPRANVSVDGDALRIFRRAVFERYGNYYGHLHEEATNALLDRARALAESRGA
jgi:hypothetical protein